MTVERLDMVLSVCLGFTTFVTSATMSNAYIPPWIGLIFLAVICIPIVLFISYLFSLLPFEVTFSSWPLFFTFTALSSVVAYFASKNPRRDGHDGPLAVIFIIIGLMTGYSGLLCHYVVQYVKLQLWS
jgi:hypothetical protein